MRRQRWGIGLLAVVLVGGLASSAVADVVTERSGSILVFPKVVADGSRDTIIQITNTSNSMVHAHCFYVNGALTFPDQDPGPSNPAKARAPATPPAGPDSTAPAATRVASASGTTPPCDWMIRIGAAQPSAAIRALSASR